MSFFSYKVFKINESFTQHLTFDYIIADLGVSSFQIDQADRGFSFMKDARLDMRMSPTLSSKTAFDFVNYEGEEELRGIFWKYGEERYTRRIVDKIIRLRKVAPIETTGELARLVADAIPAKKQTKIHPATRVFQALRIAVNHELEEVESLLEKVLSLLNDEGRLAIITFHSLEDRLVKQTFREWQNLVCVLPICLFASVRNFR